MFSRTERKERFSRIVLKSPGSDPVPVRVRPPAPRQNNTIWSPAAAGGVRSTVGVVFPFQLGGLTGDLRVGLSGSFASVMNTRTTSKQGRKVMGLQKTRVPQRGLLLFSADGIRICNRRGRLHLVKSFIVSEGRTIQRIDEVLFDELYRFYRRASCWWSRTPRWRSPSPTAPASWRPGASLSAAPARNWPPLWMQRLNSLTKTYQIRYK